MMEGRIDLVSSERENMETVEETNLLLLCQAKERSMVNRSDKPSHQLETGMKKQIIHPLSTPLANMDIVTQTRGWRIDIMFLTLESFVETRKPYDDNNDDIP